MRGTGPIRLIPATRYRFIVVADDTDAWEVRPGRLADVAPTILDLLDLPTPARDDRGIIAWAGSYPRHPHPAQARSVDKSNRRGATLYTSIVDIWAREILDSRANPTVEVDVGFGGRELRPGRSSVRSIHRSPGGIGTSRR